jgi:hypothetical protein
MKFSKIEIILFFMYPLFIDWVNEWLFFNTNSAIFQLYYGENKLIINEMMMRSALFYTNTLSWIFIVLAHWNNSPRVEMSLHSDILNEITSIRLYTPCYPHSGLRKCVYDMIEVISIEPNK